MPQPNSLWARVQLALHNINIASKIIVPYIGLAAVISIFGSFIIASWTTGLMDDAARTQIDMATTVTSKTFSQYESETKAYARSLANSAGLAQALRARDTSGVRQVVLPITSTYRTDFFEILSADGIVVFNSNGPYAEGSNLSAMPLIQGANLDINSSKLITTPEGSALTAVSPIKDLGGKTGYVLLGYNANAAFLNRIKQVTGRDISLFSEDTLIATTLRNAWQVGCSTGDCHKQGFAGAISSEIKVGGTPPETTNMLGHSYMINHGTVMLSGEPAAFFTVIMPMDSIVRVQNVARGIIFILAAALMILITTLGYLISKGIATPLRELSSISKRVSRGDLTPRMEYPGTRDEIGELSESFNRMTESLQRYTSNLRKRLLELSVLYETSVSTRTVYDLESLLELIIQNAGKAVNGDNGSLLLLDDTGGRLILKAGFNIPASLPNRVAFDIDTGNFEWLDKRHKRSGDEINITLKRIAAACVSVRNNKSILLNRQDHDPEMRQLLIDTKSSSLVSVPLRTRDFALGVIVLGRSESKPAFSDDDRNFLITMSAQSAAYIDNRKLIENLRESYIATVRALAEAVDAKDQYTRGHSMRVAAYSVAIARELNLSDDEIEGIETAAYLHDVGKIGISDRILLKPGKLTLEEMETVRGHPKIGAKILSPINFPWEIVPIIFQHHERYGGGGYPSKLSYEEIHIGARILVVADSYEAMTSERPYRAALSQQTAIEELKKGSGTQFDPVIVEAFLKVLERGFDKELADAEAHQEQ